MASKSKAKEKDEEAKPKAIAKVKAKKFKGVVAKNFRSGGKMHKVGDSFSTNSKKGLLNLINNGLIKSSLEKERVDSANKRILKWQQ